MRSLPLVDSPDNMILLGSVQRYELIKMIDRQIGREKRLEMAAKWQKQAAERALEELEKLQQEQNQIEERNRTRRPSRFEVMPAPDILELRERANMDSSPSQQRRDDGRDNNNQPLPGLQPKKSILKKTNSFNMKGSTPASPSMTPYSTITGAESRIRSAFDVIFRKSATLQDVTPDVEGGTLPSSPTSESMPSPGILKKVQLVSLFNG